MRIKLLSVCTVLALLMALVPVSLSEGEESFMVSNWDNLYSALITCSSSKKSSVTLKYPSGFNPASDIDRLAEVFYSVGAKQFSWRDTGSSVQLSNIQYYDCFRVCASAGEVTGFVNQCADEGIREFRLYFTPAFANTLFADNDYELGRTLANTRLENPTAFSYNKSYNMVAFSDALYLPAYYDIGREANTLSDFMRLFTAHTDRLDAEFGMFMSRELVDELFSSRFIGPKKTTLFSEICSNNGTYDVQWSYSCNFYRITNIRYYEGKQIAHAYKNGSVSALDSKQRETLDAALSIVNGARGTQLEIEKQIHDSLCERIEYYTDSDPHNDNDCATGALLNGKADCDGYSDAFFLCCSLAGFDVRYMHGTTLNADQENSKKVQDDSTHMWNLINIGGQWLTVDLTWDDSEKGISYLNYNIGADRASEKHIWLEAATDCKLLSVTDPSSRNAELVEYRVGSWDELYSALRVVSDKRLERVSLICADELAINQNHDRLSAAIRSVGINDFGWSFSVSNADLFNITYVDEFTICDTESEVLSALDRCAGNNTGSFRLYFSPDLGARLLSDNRSAYTALILQSRLAISSRYVYHNDYNYIAYENAEYLPSVSFASVSSFAQVKMAVEAFNARGTAVLRLKYDDSLNLFDEHAELQRIIYESGINKFEWSFYTSLNCVEISDIGY